MPRSKLAAALLEVEAALEMERRRSPVEAPLHITNGYARYLLAWGAARIDEPDRAHAFEQQARAALSEVVTDPVHRWAGAAFTTRIAQARAGEPSTDALASIDDLERLARGDLYRLERLREASRVLDATAATVGSGAPTRGRVRRAPPWLSSPGDDPLNKVTDRDQLLDELRTREPDAAVVAALHRLPASDARELLGRLVPLTAVVIGPRLGLIVEILMLALRIGAHEHAGELVRQLARAVRIEPLTTRAWQVLLAPSLRLARTPELADVRRQLIAGFGAALARPASDVDHQVLDEALAILDAAQRGGAGVAARQAALGEAMTLPIRLHKIRCVALASAELPEDEALPRFTELLHGFRDLTDSFGTNSHYSLSVLTFVDALAYGIASLRPGWW